MDLNAIRSRSKRSRYGFISFEKSTGCTSLHSKCASSHGDLLRTLSGQGAPERGKMGVNVFEYETGYNWPYKETVAGELNFGAL